jgi:hypothetical protein
VDSLGHEAVRGYLEALREDLRILTAVERISVDVGEGLVSDEHSFQPLLFVDFVNFIQPVLFLSLSQSLQIPLFVNIFLQS